MTITIYHNELNSNFYSQQGLIQNSVNLEGKEQRFNLMENALWVTITTGGTTGSTISSHQSHTPIAVAAMLIQMLLGEITPGGVGSGLITLLMYAILAAFLGSQIVGRSSQYLEKKIDSKDLKLIMLSMAIVPLGSLFFSSLILLLPNSASYMQESGRSGLIEFYYAYISAITNNGSSFAGFSSNNILHNTTIAVLIFIGKYGPLIPALALCGNLASKRKLASNENTLPFDSLGYGVALVFIILIFGALLYLPLLSLGPLAFFIQN